MERIFEKEQLACCHGTDEKPTCQVRKELSIGAQVTEEVSQHPLIRNDRDQLWENVGSRYNQVTECYVLDNDNDDSVKLNGVVLNGSYENGCVSY